MTLQQGTPFAVVLVLVSLGSAAVAATPPLAWESRGAGGGGALFSPSFSPHDPAELFTSCDMGELFHSNDSGANWSMVDFRELAGNRLSQVQFTEDPARLYCLDNDHVSSGYHPSASTDGGTTWTRLAADPTGGDAWGLFANPSDHLRLLVSDYTTVFSSTDGGLSFASVYANGGGGLGCLMAGALFDGTSVYVGTNRGLLVSTDGGVSFNLNALTGIPAGESIASFAGARQGALTRLVALTLSASTYPGIAGDSWTDFAGVYTLDIGQPAWVSRTSGITGGQPFFVGMARNDTSVIYASGGGGAGGGDPTVWKSTNGGATWAQSLLTPNNQNIATGWCGHQGDRQWSYAELAFGFAVAPLDSNRVAFTDFGFLHLTTDGGALWRQAYVQPSGEHPAGSPTPQRRHYRSNGLENTSSYYMLWTSAANIFAGFCDTRGLRSTDGGVSWGFDYSGHTENSMYEIVRDASTGTIYGATSTVHDIYQSTRLSDATLNGGGGRVLFSVDEGATWQVLHDFAHPVICLAVDPNVPGRLYASVIHSTLGDVYVTSNLAAGGASTWMRLASPPRTEGHPFDLDVLADGTLLVTYSGRRAPGFTASSGVFASTDGGVSWTDRGDPAMVYWTKDLVVDPHDPAQNTWYVGVWSGWGAAAPGFPSPGGQGGLYRTTDRGLTWTRISSVDRVTSCTISPNDPDELYFTSEEDGLWHTENLSAPAPVFAVVASYPFRQPERVYYNPFVPGEIWVTSFGNALRVGSVGVASACGDCSGDGLTSIVDALIAAQAGAGLRALTPTEFAACNVQGTLGGPGVVGTTVNVLDALTLARFALGLVPMLSCLP